MNYLTADQVTNADYFITAIKAEFPDASDFRFGAGLNVVGPAEAYPFICCQFVFDGALYRAGFNTLGEFFWDGLAALKDCEAGQNPKKGGIPQLKTTKQYKDCLVTRETVTRVGADFQGRLDAGLPAGETVDTVQVTRVHPDGMHEVLINTDPLFREAARATRGRAPYPVLAVDSDSETYQVDGTYVRIVWGYAVGNETGEHCDYDTTCCCYTWTGGPCKLEDLPGVQDERWEPVTGFSPLEDEDGAIDWTDYSVWVDDILEGL